MKIKTINLFCLLLITCSCKSAIYRNYSFKQKGVRELNLHFQNDSLGTFNVRYLCSDSIINIEQKFSYKKISDNKILIQGNKEYNHDLFIYVPLKEIKTCSNSNKYIDIEKIPVINKEEILIYKKNLFWQKINNEKIISAFTFKAKK